MQASTLLKVTFEKSIIYLFALSEIDSVKTMSETLLEQIKEQGELVRKLKAAKEPAAKVSVVIIAKHDLNRSIFFLFKNGSSLQKFIKFKENRLN